MKELLWLGSSKVDLKSSPAAIIQDAGYQLFRVQCGLEPDDWKPITTIGPGVNRDQIERRNWCVSNRVSGDTPTGNLCGALFPEEIAKI